MEYLFGKRDLFHFEKRQRAGFERGVYSTGESFVFIISV